MSGGSEKILPTGEGSPRKSNETNWSNSPKSSPRIKSRRPEDDAKKAQQKQAYVAWMNSQLRKLPNSRIVDDLAQDMQDGIALAQLIEVVAGEKIHVTLEPSSQAIMKENIEKILQFISAKKIRLHHVTSKDIVNGNLKAIMRLILALAAHFKPSSVRTPVADTRPGRRVRRTESSLSAVAADAAATLHDVSRAAASVGTPYYGSRFRSKILNSSPSTSSIESNEKDSKVISKHLTMTSGGLSRIPLSQSEIGVKRSELSRELSSKSDTTFEKSTKVNDSLSTKIVDSDAGESKKTVPKKRIAISCNHWREIVEGYNIMGEDVQETKKHLLHLQDVLLGEARDEQSLDDNDLTELDATLLHEQVAILNARLHQRSSEYDEVKNELHRTREECINLQGIKQGLQCRLSDQEQVMMKLKAELLKLSFSHQAANSDKTELQKLLEDRDREIALLRSELQSKDSQLEKQKEKLETALVRAADVDTVESDLRSKIRKHEANSAELRTQVKALQQRLRSVGASEVKLSKRITYQDRKVTLLEDKLLRDQVKPKCEQIETVRHCLRQLRRCFPAYDSQLNILDSLQEAMTNIADFDFLQSPTNDICKVTENNNYHNGISPGAEKDSVTSRTPEVTPVTRITYYQPKFVTPSVTTVMKRLGEITLRDIKTLIPGDYRYYFKALDPEFGTIREELVNDDDILPGWDSKIMAWITEKEDDVRVNYHGNAGPSKRSETDI